MTDYQVNSKSIRCPVCNVNEGDRHVENCPVMAENFDRMNKGEIRGRGAEAVDNAIGGHGIDSVILDEADSLENQRQIADETMSQIVGPDPKLPDVMVGVEVPPAGTEGLYRDYPRPPCDGLTAKQIEAEEKIKEIDGAIRANWPPLPVEHDSEGRDVTPGHETEFAGSGADAAPLASMGKDDAFEVWIYRKIGEGYGQATRARAASAEKAFLYAFEEQGEPNVDAPAPDPNTEEYYERLYHVLRQAFTTLINEGFDPIEINASACGMARRSMEQLVGKDKAIAWDNFVRKNIGWDKAKARIIYPNQVVKGRRGKS